MADFGGVRSVGDGALQPSVKFRPDIEGLRALAVLLVLLYHADVPGFSGGYVGVDVFFVVSGFLITGLLMAEADRTATVNLGRFYARRIRRLLPASATVTVAVVFAAWATYPPLSLAEFRNEALSAAGYVANMFYATAGRDYFADVGASPFQHYWSLALEEQFYLVWPLLIIAAVGTARRARRDIQIDLTAVFILVVALSFAASVVVTAYDRAVAFFLLPTRAWEFGVGALLALLSRRGVTVPRGDWLLVGGVAAIGLSAVSFDSTTAFPGVVALLPVAGTAAVILASQERHPVLCWSVSQWIGRRSYSLYLWHWPILVFIPTESLAARLILLGLSAGLAAVTFRMVESPLRHHRVLTGRRSFAFGAAITTASAAAVLVATVQPTFEYGPPAELATADALPALLASQSLQTPANLRPSLDEVRSALPQIYRDGCHRSFVETSVGGCEYGDLSSNVTVVLFGDSHAAQWFPAMIDIANREGWRLVSLTKSSCPPVDVPRDVNRDHDHECRSWIDNAVNRINAEEPHLVVAGTHSYGGRFGLPLDVWMDGLARTLSRMTRAERIVLMGAVPELPEDVPSCLSGNLGDTSNCRANAADVLNSRMPKFERAVLAQVGGLYIDTVPMVCPREVCPVIAGDVLMYRDRHHLTPDYVRLLAQGIRRTIVR